MKTLNVTIAALFLVILVTSSCATRSPAVVEHEEEVIQKNKEKDNRTEREENRIWREHLRDRGYSD